MLHALPLIERELLAAARNPRLYRVRLAHGAVIFLLCATFFYLQKALGGALATGSEFFMGLSMAALMICLFTGVSPTLDSLSGEKREGTLGLLFLTNLKAGDVVMGKFAAAVIGSFATLLTSIPVFAICLTMGGVPAGEFLRVLLNLAVTLLFTLTIGMFGSATAREYKQASNRAVSIVLLFAFVFPGAAELLRRYFLHPELAFALRFLSPLYSYQMALESSAGSPENYYWWSILGRLLLSALFLTAAAFVLQRTWQDEPKTRRFWASLFARHSAPSARTLARRSWWLDFQPVAWLALRRPETRGWWFFLIAATLLAAAGWARYGSANPEPVAGLALVAGISLTAGSVLSAAVSAPIRLAQDRLSGGLELLLTTPQTVPNIIQGHWTGLIRQYAPFFAALLLADAGLIVLFNEVFHQGNLLQAPGSVALICATFFVQAIAAVWTAMWLAMTVRHPAHIAGGAMFWCFVLPFPIWAACQWVPIFTGPAGWAALAAINSLAFGLGSRTKLYSRFREAAAQTWFPPAAKAPLLSRLLKKAPPCPSSNAADYAR